MEEKEEEEEDGIVMIVDTEKISGYIDDGSCNPQCSLSMEPSYVIYSAVGSFYAPMLVMLFFNWRIYKTAKKTTEAIRQGFTR